MDELNERNREGSERVARVYSEVCATLLRLIERGIRRHLVSARVAG